MQQEGVSPLLRILLNISILGSFLHLLAIMYTGGYEAAFAGISITGRYIVLPTIVTLGLILLSFVAKKRSFKEAFFEHEFVFLFFFLLAIYLANGKTHAEVDTWGARYLPMSILREGDFDLDEFSFAQPQDTDIFEPVNGHLVSRYPVGAALLAIPFFIPSALGSVPLNSPFLMELEKLSASVILVLSGIILYFLFRSLTTHWISFLLLVVYALGTSSFSVTSQALWQHTAGQLGLAFSLYCIAMARKKSIWIIYAGFALSFAIISRPTNLLVAIGLGLFVVISYYRHIPWFLLAGLPPVLFQLWYNATYFGAPFHTQWPIIRGGLWGTPLLEGLLGILFSPSRGLLIYSPIFLLSFLGIIQAARRNGERLVLFAGLGSILTILLYSKFSMWWGGGSYGPRLLSDLNPIMTFCLYPLLSLLSSAIYRKIFCALLAFSVYSHAIGMFWDDRTWNAFHNPEKLWSWSNNQLMNSSKEMFGHLMIGLTNIPTSRSAPGLLSVRYQIHEFRKRVSASRRMEFYIAAFNDGKAVWIRRGFEEGTMIVLALWSKDGQYVWDLTSIMYLESDVYPGESYTFRIPLRTPDEIGMYRLDIGLARRNARLFPKFIPNRMLFNIKVIKNK